MFEFWDVSVLSAVQSQIHARFFFFLSPLWFEGHECEPINTLDFWPVKWGGTDSGEQLLGNQKPLSLDWVIIGSNLSSCRGYREGRATSKVRLLLLAALLVFKSSEVSFMLRTVQIILPDLTLIVKEKEKVELKFLLNHKIVQFLSCSALNHQFRPVLMTLLIFSFSGLVVVSPCGLLLEWLSPCILVWTALTAF